MSEWQPISSTPKDGTFYLAVLDRQGWYAVLNEPPGCARGQWFLIDGGWRGESDAFKPTHWMPLPEPPSLSISPSEGAKRGGGVMRKEVIGNATLYLGDCMEILPTLPKVDAVITDPPYGIGMASWDSEVPVEWFGIALDLLTPEGAAYVFGDAVTLSGFQVHWEQRVKWKARIVWCYEDGPRNSAAWTSKHEDCLFYAGPKHKLRTPKEPSIHRDPRWGDDRLMGDVWRIPRVLGNYGEREQHPTQKPVELMRLPIIGSTSQDQVVLDPFTGSGSTGVAAIELGRSFIGIEREPKYFDIACRRIEQAYKQRPLFEAEPPQAPQQLGLESA